MSSHIQAWLLTASLVTFLIVHRALRHLGEWVLGPALRSLLLSDSSPHRACFSTHHIFGIWLHGDGPVELFSSSDSEVIFQVEDSLLPVGVGGIGGWGGRDRGGGTKVSEKTSPKELRLGTCLQVTGFLLGLSDPHTRCPALVACLQTPTRTPLSALGTPLPSDSHPSRLWVLAGDQKGTSWYYKFISRGMNTYPLTN